MLGRWTFETSEEASSFQSILRRGWVDSSTDIIMSENNQKVTSKKVVQYDQVAASPAILTTGDVLVFDDREKL